MEDQLWVEHVGGSGFLGVGGRAPALFGDKDGAEAMVSLSRSACAPDLPMAATMRPSSGPARRRRFSRAASWRWRRRRGRRLHRGRTGDADLKEFGGAFAIADDLKREVAHTPASAVSKALATVPFTSAAGDWPVAAMRSVSEVEVSLVDRDGVEGGAEVAVDHLLERGLRDLRVGEDVDEHGGHVRRYHAEPLGDAGDVMGPPSPCRVAAAPLGKVSVVMIASAAIWKPASDRSAARAGMTAVILPCGSVRR